MEVNLNDNTVCYKRLDDNADNTIYYYEKDVSADDQTIKSDYGKAKLSLVPMQILYDIAAIREYGNAKYPKGGPNNWMLVEPERYRDAMLRHMVEYIRDPDSVDKESGFKHLWHLACNVAFLCELEKG